MKKIRKPIKLIVYTVLVGDKEALNDPLLGLGTDATSDLEIEFVCFTDRTDRTSSTWRFAELRDPIIPPEKLSRRPKALPHHYFPDAEFSLYIDNTVAFKRLPRLSDITAAPFRAFRHPWRSNPADEADIVARSGLDDPDTVAAQLRHYETVRPLRTVERLTAGTVLLRRHHDASVRRFGETWWQQILMFSKRDQISLDICADYSACSIEHFPGNKLDNDLFLWPVVSGGKRIQGSFDAEKYAWEHRADSAARLNPRAHFLASVGGDVAKYERRPPFLDYACNLHGSGLGHFAPPRRGLSGVVEIALTRPQAHERILVAGANDNPPYSVDTEELAATRDAVLHRFRYDPLPEIVLAQFPASALAEAAPFRSAEGQAGFSLILALGLPTASHRNTLAKFIPLLGTKGILLVEFSGSLDAVQIQAMHAGINKRGRLDVFHGTHICHAAPIPGSVFLLTLESPKPGEGA